MGSLAQGSSGAIRCSFPGKVPEGTEGSGADIEVRFRKVLVQTPGGRPEGSGRVPGGFLCRA